MCQMNTLTSLFIGALYYEAVIGLAGVVLGALVATLVSVLMLVYRFPLHLVPPPADFGRSASCVMGVPHRCLA